MRPTHRTDSRRFVVAGSPQHYRVSNQVSRSERTTLRTLSAVLAIVLFPIPVFAGSYYPNRIDDAKAVYLTRENFAVQGDGVADDSEPIQQAINKVQDTTNQGILFVPSGRYRLTKTIYIWPGIRLIGYGATRPVLVL